MEQLRHQEKSCYVEWNSYVFKDANMKSGLRKTAFTLLLYI